jgi:hypothetical protein
VHALPSTYAAEPEFARDAPGASIVHDYNDAELSAVVGLACGVRFGQVSRSEAKSLLAFRYHRIPEMGCLHRAFMS